ncbi:hypothetical protein MOMA_06881 [Moraxella macacae 0408225]|uniref:Uncharacterized protein n=1 Tax=Moraxella macacae 0408225 TaxID=1230338 RepID=L2F657_9GAMM|nr:hypothetical protein [Moraxella macacae]ELA08266.1 hypothetical protein MOMA_06881 [Moraxella macacae 0408225]
MKLDDLNKLSDNQLSQMDFKKMSEEDDEKKSKLTHWKKEPTLNELKRDFQNTQSSHSSFVADLDRWIGLYNAPKFGDKKHKGSRVVPKLVRKQAEWRCPSLSEPFLSTTQLFEVKPLTFDDVERAKQNALILNMQFNTQLNRVSLVDKIVRSVVKHGTAIVRLGWEYQEDEVEENIEQFEYTPVAMPQMPEIPPEQMPPEMAEQMAQMEQNNPATQLQQQYEQLAQLRQLEPDSISRILISIYSIHKKGSNLTIQQRTNLADVNYLDLNLNTSLWIMLKIIATLFGIFKYYNESIPLPMPQDCVRPPNSWYS